MSDVPEKETELVTANGDGDGKLPGTYKAFIEKFPALGDAHWKHLMTMQTGLAF